MISGMYVLVYFSFVVNKSSSWLFGRDKITVFIKPSYNRNDSVIKTLVIYMCEIEMIVS